MAQQTGELGHGDTRQSAVGGLVSMTASTCVQYTGLGLNYACTVQRTAMVGLTEQTCRNGLEARVESC